MRAARAEPMQLPEKCKRQRERCHIPEALGAFTWCFSYAAKTLCLRVCAYTCGSAPSDSFLWIYQPNSYTNCWSTTCKLTLDHSSERSQAWVKQKCKCKDSAKFPLGSTRYRHSFSGSGKDLLHFPATSNTPYWIPLSFTLLFPFTIFNL